jgi:hypothetical protein
LASKRRVRARECGTKKKYRKEEISNVARALTLKEGELLKGYRCPWCAWWHIGHPKVIRE